ncbi:hypothetical protein [Maricaulis sp.]|uniref:hypothetical protein n=1 Tax=Maricaulis sp. TaxID=1486257 RepID=UPI003A8F43CA
MLRITALVSAACLLAAPLASAQDAASRHPVLEQALSQAPIIVDEREWRFLVTMTSDDGTMIGRFDGTRPDGERWSLVSPEQDALSDLQAGMWTGLQEPDEDGEDSGLFFSADDSDITPGSLELTEETADHLVFNFRPQFDGEEAAMAEHVRGALTVSRQGASVTRLRMWAPESFKPHFAVRLNEFDMVQEYTAIDGLPAPVLTHLRQSISGRAAFQSFDQSFELAFSEIEFLGGNVDGAVD